MIRVEKSLCISGEQTRRSSTPGSSVGSATKVPSPYGVKQQKKRGRNGRRLQKPYRARTAQPTKAASQHSTGGTQVDTSKLTAPV